MRAVGALRGRADPPRSAPTARLLFFILINKKKDPPLPLLSLFFSNYLMNAFFYQKKVVS
jgi:hypothetical protein